MPYSLNEKSGLASVVIKPEEILTFDKKDAIPENVIPKMQFLRRDVIPGESKKLLVQAFDHKVVMDVPKFKEKKEFEPIVDAVPEQYFPPCIQLISQGLKDGKKRALFVLINFLSTCGWGYDKIENYLTEWNKRNPEPLREVLIQGQLRYHKSMKKRVLPANCANKAYMVDMGVCKPDGFCGANTEPGEDAFAPRIKNPANYAIARQRITARMAEKGKKTPKKDKPASKAL